MLSMLLYSVPSWFIFAVLVESTITKPLILTGYIESGNIDEAKELSRVKCPQFTCDTESYSGYFTVDRRYNSNLFFWFFKSKNPEAAVLLWLQGGPGDSSLFGLFNENGPFIITKEEKVKCRKSSWTKQFSVLYIDQPVGTGFSFTDENEGYSKNLNESTINLYSALTQFFTMFSEVQGNDFYLTGESYAGKYVPAIAYKIHIEKNPIFNLKGIATGNGYYDLYSSMAYGAYLYQISLLDQKQKAVFDKRETEIKNLMDEGNYVEAFYKFESLILNDLYEGKTLFTEYTGYSNYFNLLFTRITTNDTLLETYLNRVVIKTCLHVGNRKFTLDVDDKVVEAFIGDFLRSVKDILAIVMDNYKVLLYGGQVDINLPPVLSHNVLPQLKWKYQTELNKSKRNIWKLGDEVVGYVKNVHDFYEVVVRNAGHLVSHDQPEVAYELISSFVNGYL